MKKNFKKYYFFAAILSVLLLLGIFFGKFWVQELQLGSKKEKKQEVFLAQKIRETQGQEIGEAEDADFILDEEGEDIGILETENLDIDEKQEMPRGLSPDLSFESQLGNQENISEPRPPEINSAQRAKVVRVFDGDTIEIEGNQKVRYLGINTPETGEPFWAEAKGENSRLVMGQIVFLEFDIQTKDRYDRLLAYVWADDVLINQEMARLGLAISQTIQPNVKYQKIILEAEREARANCRGLWSGLCQDPKNTAGEQGAHPLRCVQIALVQANAPGDDNKNKNGEWVKIKNVCEKAISMDGWLLKDSSASNSYQFKNFVLAGLESAFLYSGCGIDSGKELYWQCPEKKYAVWNNDGDRVFLYDESDFLVDDYAY